MSTHSDKAMTTIKLMGSEPEQWVLTPIKWEERTIPWPGLVKCPVCLGDRYVRYGADGKPIVPPAEADWSERNEYSRIARQVAQDLGKLHVGTCENCRCKNRRSWDYNHSTGRVPGMVPTKMKVGTPQWPEGTQFISRFQFTGDCQLCNKTIKKSGLVPVMAQRADGVRLGMWVGQDCARKFLDVKSPLKKGYCIEKID